MIVTAYIGHQHTMVGVFALFVVLLIPTIFT